MEWNFFANIFVNQLNKRMQVGVGGDRVDSVASKKVPFLMASSFGRHLGTVNFSPKEGQKPDFLPFSTGFDCHFLKNDATYFLYP